MAINPIKTYQPYQMTKVAEFGGYPKNARKENNRGMMVPQFVKEFSLHYAKINQTISQKYETIGTQFEDSQIIAVQHNGKLKETMICRIENQDYKILNISVNDKDYLSYDLVTIKKVTEVR